MKAPLPLILRLTEPIRKGRHFSFAFAPDSNDGCAPSAGAGLVPLPAPFIRVASGARGFQSTLRRRVADGVDLPESTKKLGVAFCPGVPLATTRENPPRIPC
jgi:hypothetical protein